MTDGWQMRWQGFDPGSAGTRETLTTLGNGRFCIRGALPVGVEGAGHYPALYLAGGYDRAVSMVQDRLIENEDLVRFPDPFRLSMTVEGELATFSEADRESLDQVLDLKTGLLTRRFSLRAGERSLRVEETRFVSMDDPRLAAMSVNVTPLGWSGEIRCDAVVDGSIRNAGVPRYAALEGRHVDVHSAETIAEEIAVLGCRTRQSSLEVALAIRVKANGAQQTSFCTDTTAGLTLVARVADGEALAIEHVAAVATGRDSASASPSSSAKAAAATAPPFETLRACHETAWSRLWDEFDAEMVDGSGDHQANLRLNTFHLIQTLSPHTAELDVGAPARGWHGEAYRGHVFWDEIFVFRVLNLRAPRLTRALLRYRLRRLGQARSAAASAGFRGAMFPWQSGSDGREETQTVHLNPRSGTWLPDETYRQRHVGLAVAYNIWTYFRATGDLEFLSSGGAEMMVEIARFFASLAEEGDDGRWHLRGVMGPDEFQTAYPGRHDGIDDNAYTNVLCAWVMAQTIEALEHLPIARRQHLAASCGLSAEERDQWQLLSERLYVPFSPNGLIAQFDGYDALEEFDWAAYRERYGDISRLDRILEAEGRDVNAYKASKQADVLMLLFLFTADELTAAMAQLGYTFDPSRIPELVQYYDSRTSHGSTLSAVVHAWVVARSDRVRSWTLFGEALRADADDTQGGTTREGIHLGAMCGTLDILQSGYVGLDARGGALRVDPVLPTPLTAVRTRIHYRGQDVLVEVADGKVRLTAGGGIIEPIAVAYRDKHRHLPPGAITEFPLVTPREAREAPGRPDEDQRLDGPRSPG